MSDRFDYEGLEVIFLTQTDAAILVEYADDDLWVPKSVLSHSMREINDWEKGDNINIKVAAWFVKKNT